jgi:xanthine/CO dehydrogenase XdhC/CoxF family maturation factor
MRLHGPIGYFDLDQKTPAELGLSCASSDIRQHHKIETNGNASKRRHGNAYDLTREGLLHHHEGAGIRCRMR